MRNKFYHHDMLSAVHEVTPDTWASELEATATSSSLEALLPRLHALSLRSHQWVTVIGATRDVVEKLVAAGISRTRIRWVCGRNQDEREWATEQALLAGTSSIVLSWLGELAPRTQQRLKMASKVSHTHSFIFDEQPSRTPLH
ncbi:MAG: hypothetical protein R3273_08645 [Pseudidiomarina maritima]|uniref:Cell division inhibitor SulA n=2 Tax=Pseudidiomarina TaxID=2800384 RepID=A0AB39X8N4_9GAMM|nr:hypothetical protein [Pseudidiomarina sp. GXY010]MDT7526470.1 hypothetical protein [Pseudidiomarina sp. GXY010]MDX1526295.1 hypothetical protein [Pseudidiomarina maritima]